MKDKKTLTTILATFLLMALIVSATYAYFTANLSDGTETSINALTGTTDSLSFFTSNNVKIHATVENFAKGKGNSDIYQFLESKKLQSFYLWASLEFLNG